MEFALLRNCICSRWNYFHMDITAPRAATVAGKGPRERAARHIAKPAIGQCACLRNLVDKRADGTRFIAGPNWSPAPRGGHRTGCSEMAGYRAARYVDDSGDVRSASRGGVLEKSRRSEA